MFAFGFAKLLHYYSLMGFPVSSNSDQNVKPTAVTNNSKRLKCKPADKTPLQRLLDTSAKPT